MEFETTSKYANATAQLNKKDLTYMETIQQAHILRIFPLFENRLCSAKSQHASSLSYTVRPALNRKFFLRARWMFSYLKMQYTPSIKTRLLTHMCLLASPAVSANGDCLFAWRGPISHVSSAWYVRLFSCRLKVPATLLASVLSFYMSQKYNNAKWRAGQPLERPYQRLF